MGLGEFLIRMTVGAGLGALIGLEREVTGKEAGLRTHALVGLGSALFTVISFAGFDAGDPSRVAAQIVSGIGFLGAGAIFRSGPLVKGLTTAAGLWAAAAIGMASGTGDLLWATSATGVAFVVLTLLRKLDIVIDRFRIGSYVEAVVAPPRAYDDVRTRLESLDPRIELDDLVTTGHTATLRFIVNKGRRELLRHALDAMDEVVETRILR